MDMELERIKKEFEACETVYGYYTANIEGKPLVAFIEYRTTEDEPRLKDDGIDHFYIIHRNGMYDTYIFNDSELMDFAEGIKATGCWEFHFVGNFIWKEEV